jgi:hypothetical protein
MRSDRNRIANAKRSQSQCECKAIVMQTHRDHSEIETELQHERGAEATQKHCEHIAIVVQMQNRSRNAARNAEQKLRKRDVNASQL